MPVPASSLGRRLTSERAAGVWVAVFVVVQALGFVGLVGLFLRERHTRQRVTAIERPSPAEMRRRLRVAISGLATADARTLLRTLLASAGDAERRAIRELAEELDDERRRQSADHGHRPDRPRLPAQHVRRRPVAPARPPSTRPPAAAPPPPRATSTSEGASPPPTAAASPPSPRPRLRFGVTPDGGPLGLPRVMVCIPGGVEGRECIP